MEGYRIMAESYRKLVKDGKMTEEEAASDIKIYDFLAECTQDDIYNLFNSGAFNDITKAYLRKALVSAEINDEEKGLIMEELRWSIDTMTAKEVVER
jgi:hypothetical protein